jgi:hypothetical protein
MSPHRSDNRDKAQRPASGVRRHCGPAPTATAGEVAGSIDGASSYLTDGVFLYRVVSSVPSAVGELVELEDCFSLDVVYVQQANLRARGLRSVTPGPAR